MDSLTAHYLARELHSRWSGRRVSLCNFNRERSSVTIGAGGSELVCFDLGRPDVIARSSRAVGVASPLDGFMVVNVQAPTDDRRLIVRLEKAGKFRGSSGSIATLQISAVPHSRGALAVTGGGHRLAAVGSVPPPLSEPRPELTDQELDKLAADGDASSLLRGRWMSPELARWLLANPESIAGRYREITELRDAQPAWCGGRLLPFPWCDDAEPAASLIYPDTHGDDPQPEYPDDRKTRALERMHRELSLAANASGLREAADHLMEMRHLETPPDEVVLSDGSRIPLSHRQGETPAALAARLYAKVRSMERAIETLPARIRKLEESEQVNAGAISKRAGPVALRTSSPFRTYRSTGGLDIWVGRGAKSNDQLTFRESAPNDVWLHARDAAGAHVVLRWSRDERPPASDLEEAAQLAAWHSRARGSVVVPVDWTRRKHVRKPRGAAPGMVVLARAATILARPDAAAERRMRAGW